MNGKVRILVVDDEPEIRKTFQEYLELNGYQVTCADGSASARKILEEHDVHLALLDVAMPGEDGLSLARYLREHKDLDIIIVASAGEAMDRIIGLEVGADDYLSKPVDLRELAARIAAVLRWKHGAAAAPPALAGRDDNTLIRLGECDLDVESHRLLGADGEEIPITEMDFQVLKLFSANPGRTLSRERIVNQTRGRDWNPADRSVDLQIGRIRRKIEPDPKKPSMIKTVYSRGYVFYPPEN